MIIIMMIIIISSSSSSNIIIKDVRHKCDAASGGAAKDALRSVAAAR